MSPASSTPSRDQRPTVRLDQGAFVGTTLSEPDFPRGVEAFLGVPYAKCLRLRRPEAPGQSGDSFDAAEYGPVCPTADPTYPADEEGCLNANIFRPAGEVVGGKKRVPVLVYSTSLFFPFPADGAAFLKYLTYVLTVVESSAWRGLQLWEGRGQEPCGLCIVFEA